MINIIPGMRTSICYSENSLLNSLSPLLDLAAISYALPCGLSLIHFKYLT